MISLLLTMAAHALVGDKVICIEAVPTFDDSVAGAGRFLLDDYLSDNSVEPLRGLEIRLSDNTIAGLQIKSAAHGGATPGCATFTVNTGHSYTVLVASTATIGTNTLALLDDPTTPTRYFYTFSTNWIPLNLTSTRTWTMSGGGRAWNIMLASAWALHHRDGGMTNETFTMYNDTCANGGLCYDDALDAIHVATNKRVIIAHELGHYLLHRKAGTGANNSTDAPAGACHSPADALGNFPAHEMQQKEYGNEAFWEGWAQFYASVAFNAKAGGDCFIQYYKPQDYDLDGLIDPLTTNCNGVPWEDGFGNAMDAVTYGGAHSPLVGPQDYLTDAVVDLVCDSGSLANRATEYDYNRFFWDLYQNDVTVAEMMDIIVLADMATWTQTGAYADTPYPRLLDAAAAYDLVNSTAIWSVWDAQANVNGVYR